MNENTKNTFNGNLIKLEELNTNLEDQLIQIIFHMQQCGIEIDIDYSFIKEYSANNLYKLDILENNKFSNKELKLLRSSVAELNTDLKYSILSVDKYSSLTAIKQDIRKYNDVSLMAVTKNRSENDILDLYNHNILLFGENKVKRQKNFLTLI